MKLRDLWHLEFSLHTFNLGLPNFLNCRFTWRLISTIKYDGLLASSGLALLFNSHPWFPRELVRNGMRKRPSEKWRNSREWQDRSSRQIVDRGTKHLTIMRDGIPGSLPCGPASQLLQPKQGLSSCNRSLLLRCHQSTREHKHFQVHPAYGTVSQSIFKISSLGNSE